MVALTDSCPCAIKRKSTEKPIPPGMQAGPNEPALCIYCERVLETDGSGQPTGDTLEPMQVRALDTTAVRRVRRRARTIMGDRPPKRERTASRM